ncbi:helix-turn-helix domain-containing protein [Hymenobacter sp.]|jgi:transposase|uniref:helix-turn-helix domain-containing protein n=1 Tax=Hymenobacter sp. TaxID=1898978 RepID=UPI002ED8B201
MQRLAPLVLTPSQVQALEHSAAHAPHPRQRKRAQAVLSHHRGLRLQHLAVAYATRRDTVRAWLTRFETGGVAALAEGARSGRPPKRSANAQKK